MKNLILTIATTLVLGLAPSSVQAQSSSNVSMDSMTSPQLEAAADAARSQKDYFMAERYLVKAISKDRKNAVLYNKLGLTQMKDNDMQSARANFQKAAKLDSKYADALNNIGAIDYLQKNYGAAAKQFKKAVALEETRASFHVNLGAAWFGQKKLEGAINEYARALELDPMALEASSKAGVTALISPEERAKYSFMLAKIYAKQGDLDRCIQCLRKAKEEGYTQLANVYRDEEFASVRHDSRLSEVVPLPAK